MKKIINGKKYNTETAKVVGSWSNNHSYSDLATVRKHCMKRELENSSCTVKVVP